MKLDGRKLAESIHKQTKTKLERLKARGINPTIAIVTVGPEAAWEAYVGQKIKFAELLGIDKKVINLKNEDEKTLQATVQTLNEDPTITGIIVQRPLPNNFDQNTVTNLISPQKDIDGFRKDSLHEVPVWLAVKRFLEEVCLLQGYPLHQDVTFADWLTSKNVVIIGKGESAGKLIIKGLYKMGVLPHIIDSKTKNPEAIQQQADIIISSTGKKVVEAKNLKKGVILIGVGIDRGEDNKLYGDYNEEEIKDIASFYTPTPGGVGPLNLAYLFNNLANAAYIVAEKTTTA